MVRKRTYMLAAAVLLTPCVLSAATEDASSSPETIVKAGVPGGFWQGFIASLSVVIVSELGDKTFFIAAIMAMKHARVVVFAGAISALVFMTILSAAFGSIATFIPRIYTYYISAALFAIFGIKMLRDGWKMDPNEGQEELEEVQSELKRREDQGGQTKEEVSVQKNVNTESTLQLQEAARSRSPSRAETPTASVRSDREPRGSQGTPSPPSSTPEEPIAGPSTTPEMLRDEKEETLDMLEQGQADRRRKRNAVLKVVIQAATLTFLAEWGDRSQVATVVLATRENIPGVILGGSIGHALCTGLAVVGGRMIAQKISVRTVTIIGGVVFLAFAVSALFIGPGE